MANLYFIITPESFTALVDNVLHNITTTVEHNLTVAGLSMNKGIIQDMARMALVDVLTFMIWVSTDTTELLTKEIALTVKNGRAGEWGPTRPITTV